MDAAKRELEEETGYTADELTRLVEVYPSPGYTDEIIYVFLAKNVVYRGSHPDEDEFVNVQFVPLSQAEDMIERGEICDAKTIAAILKYLRSV